MKLSLKILPSVVLGMVLAAGSAPAQSRATLNGEPIPPIATPPPATPTPTPRPSPTPDPDPVSQAVPVIHTSPQPPAEPTPTPAPAAPEPSSTPASALDAPPVPPAAALDTAPGGPPPEPAPAKGEAAGEGLPIDHADSPDLSGELTSSAPPSPSQNVTINLINRLVKKGILDREEAAELIQQAEADAEMARVQAEATQEALVQVSATQAAVAEIAVTQVPAPSPEDAVRVTYIPEMVKSQIREEVKHDVMTAARKEGWAAPYKIPSWVSRIKPFGDLRVRFEADMFPEGNDNTGAFPNFNAINTGAPFDVTGNQFSPQYNADQDRYRFRIRARLGADVDLGEHFTTGFRIATGENNSPVTANQSLGLANQGQGGNFSKYAIWLDRAFLKYQLTGDPKKDVALTVGRFDNPFFTISNIMWSHEIGFDGAALQGAYEIVEGFTPFFAGGAFPFFNTDFNFSSNQPAKFPSYDKYLFAAQLGTDWKITKDINLKTAAGYFYFHNAEGQLSTPYTPLSPTDAGDTDNSRPSFAQKGNTYMALRNIIPDASNDFGTTNQWQYFGLATPFEVFTFNGRLDYSRFEPVTFSLMGEFAMNLAFDRNKMEPIAVNNRGALDDDLSDSIGQFDGGNIAWTVILQVGAPVLEKRWDWNLSAGYRYVESDAVIDGFTGSDFGGGGTNLKGYILGANLALSGNVWLGVQWLSATSIAGPTYAEDIIQFDINAKF